MSIPIVKLLYDGELEEVNITCKKKETYNLDNFLLKVNLEEEIYYRELHTWELDNKKKLILIGKSVEEGQENMHQLPIKEDYQYYDHLYVIITLDSKYHPLDMDTFENIYNALYLKIEDLTDSEESVYSSEEEELDEKDNLDEDDDNIMEDYGDGGDDGEESEEEDIDIEEDLEIEDKKKKPIKRKKIIKIPEAIAQDIMKEETENKTLTEVTRIKCLEILQSVFKNPTTSDKTYMQDVERHVFNYTLRKSIDRNIIPTWNIVFKNIYLNKVISLYSNLNKNNYINNKRLLQRIRKKEFTPEQFVNMTPQELFPEHWKELIDEKYRRDKILYETKKEAMTDQFKCSKCHSRETCYFEMQTRSADEPMTIFITCLNCGKRWKN